MSRYLEYCNEKDAVGGNSVQGRVIKNPPPKRGPVFLCGPEIQFVEYLRTRYQGVSLVCFGGRCAAGQIWPNSLLTMFMIFGPGVAYMTRVLPRYLGDDKYCFFAGMQHFLAYLIAVSFVLAAFTNPGIIPRKDKMDPDLEGHVDSRSLPTSRFLRINGITLKQKYCHSCHVFRPPRSKHCAYCDNCVLRFDHHCTWLGNCVGLYNYRYFLCLIYSATLFLSQAVFYVLRSLIVESFEFSFDFIYENALILELFVYCLFLLVAVLLLSIYHTVITMQNLTTNEHVKNYYRENPFDFGPRANCMQIYCFPETVLAEGVDVIEASYKPFGSYSEDQSFDDVEYENS